MNPSATSPLGRIERRTTKRRTNKNQVSVKKEFTKVWSDNEKKVLLDLLYQHGDSDMSLLAASLPNKHASQIKTYLRTIARRAQIAEKNRLKNPALEQLDVWIKFLKETYKGEPTDDSLPFELFALSREFSKRNIEFSNDVVDFQKAFEYLFALTVGRKPDVDERTYYFVHSYLDWFLNEFDKFVLSEELSVLSTAFKKIKEVNSDSTLTPNQALQLIFNKVLPQEQFLSSRYLLRTVCRKIRRVHFRKGDEFDRKISLLRAEVDEEPKRSNIYLNPPDCEFISFMKEVQFKNLPTFLLAALFNNSVSDLKEISKKKETKNF